MARKKKDDVEIIDFNNNDDIAPLEDNLGIVESVVPVNEDVRPRMDDPAWTNWVLAQFEPNELEEGRPKVHGLRRMVRKLIGPILKSRVDTRQVPTIENEQRSTVEATIVVLNKYNLEDDEEPYTIEFSDVADAYKGNVKGLEFARFPPQMASTRAESRAIRKLLCLDVVASEEITDQPLEEAGFTSHIEESQITKIDIKCQQYNIDVMKFINIGKTKYNRIEDVSRQTAIKMFGLINEYQQKVKPIPENIVGYKPNWRGEF